MFQSFRRIGKISYVFFYIVSLHKRKKERKNTAGMLSGSAAEFIIVSLIASIMSL